MRDRRGSDSWSRDSREASYDEVSRKRYGTGNGLLGFGAGGGKLPQVFIAFLCILVILVVRLAYIQIIDGKKYADLAEKRRTNTQVLQARRGTIYDRKGNVLAKSEECYDVYCNPMEVTDTEAEAELLAKWLGGDAQAYEKFLTQNSTFVYIQRKAEKQACESLRKDLLASKQAGVYLLEQTRRVYPYGAVCGQILGLVNVDNEGISGLELKYNDELSGVDGEMIMETGLQGIPIAGAAAKITEPRDGKDLVLSIDIDAQIYVEDQIAIATEENEAESGFAMVCDPRDGSILAACSTPYADLTKPEAISGNELNLKLVSSSYDPGSIFKVLTAAIGLESGKVQASDYFTMPGTILVGYDIVTDEDGRWEPENMNLREVLRRSSNVGAAYIAQECIGADAFAEGIERFGIGTLTGIDYPGETAGMVKSRSQYDGSSVGSMSFGQGLTIPMVQMVRAVGAIANSGKLCTPHFATAVGGKEIKWETQGEAISEGTAQKITDMMRTVVEDGTGYTAAVDGYDVAAKTGTGEQAENGTYLKGKYLASLIGFAPASNPEVLLYVGLNETPYISYSSAGPVFSAIMGEVLKDMGVLSSSWDE